MMNESLTLTLPINEQAAWVIATALGITVASFLVWLTLDEHKKEQRKPRSLLIAFGWALVPVWLILLSGTLWQLWLMMTGVENQLKGSGLGTGTLVAALLSAPFVIWGTVLKQRTVDFQKEGHITDRITSAVEQLGAEKTVKKLVGGVTQETTEPNIEVRIGAILSLERIAQDSTRYDNGRDHVRVMEILCAYVRENAPASKGLQLIPLDKEHPGEKWDEEIWATYCTERSRVVAGSAKRQALKNRLDSAPTPREDIQLALTVIGRRSQAQRAVEALGFHVGESEKSAKVAPRPPVTYGPKSDVSEKSREELQSDFAKMKDWETMVERQLEGYRLDLRGTNLQKADLSTRTSSGEPMSFSGADFSGSIMNGANMEGSDFIGADFTGCSMNFANGKRACFARAWFDDAFLDHAHLHEATAQYATFEGTSFIGTIANFVDFSHSLFQFSYLGGVHMNSCQFVEVSFSNTIVAGSAYFARSTFRKSYFLHVDFGGGSFNGANIKETCFSSISFGEGLDFESASMERCGIASVSSGKLPFNQSQLNEMVGNGRILLPKGTSKPKLWLNVTLHAKDFIDWWVRWREDPDNTPLPKPD